MNAMIAEYLERLRIALHGADRATVQDALSDAGEHLATALAQAVETDPAADPRVAVSRIVEEYGSPEEIAAGYLELERQHVPPLAPGPVRRDRSLPERFFGVIADPRAYASLLYLLLSLVTGCIYFTWAVSGISLSLGFLVMIFGIPFIAFFLISVRALALVEGRIVEALLGVRMPRRPVFVSGDEGWWKRFRALLLDGRTWSTILYFVIMLPLGTLYFCVTITLLAYSLSGIFQPVLQYGFKLPLAQFGGWSFYTPGWLMPVTVVAGLLLLLGTMHVTKGIGRLHGRIARALLVR
ncbi:MAG: sensor domain-containing protein [Candidatus Krumholzibacteriota bacterium]|nr:sensor domain-containing protein [Candidatus Krumholzibacteriota bacterium]